MKPTAIQKPTHAGKPVLGHAIEHQDLGVVGDIPDLVPDAVYAFGFARAERGHFQNRERHFLWYQIVTPGDYFGTQLYLSCAFRRMEGKSLGSAQSWSKRRRWP